MAEQTAWQPAPESVTVSYDTLQPMPDPYAPGRRPSNYRTVEEIVAHASAFGGATYLNRATAERYLAEDSDG